MIDKLVSDLPEIYQPIYGHSEFSVKAARLCEDRLIHIADVHDALQHLLARPVRVLDLGCAQGYFSLNLAKRGAIVSGLDFQEKNIAVCKALALENRNLQTEFKVGRIEDVVATLREDQYDLVLGLSVFHHIIYEKGVSEVKALLNHIANHSSALLVELALREEPLYWASALPEDPIELLSDVAFVREITRHDTHLASISRPLYVASNSYWFLPGNACRFNAWYSDPHALANGVYQTSRRYFFGSDAILKIYKIDHALGNVNEASYTNELNFLKSSPEEFDAPTLLCYGRNNINAWIAMRRLPGRLLLDILNEKGAINERKILLSILKQLAVLEASGLFHNDVRTWNVLVADNDVVHLIDYGSISSVQQDCAWPGNLFLSFFIFVYEVTTGRVDEPQPVRTIAISPARLPKPYCNWAENLWSQPLSGWSFKYMYESLLNWPTKVSTQDERRPNDIWAVAIEEVIQDHKLFTNDLSKELSRLYERERATALIWNQHLLELQKNTEILNQKFWDYQCKTAAEAAQMTGKIDELLWSQDYIRDIEEQRNALLNSFSWKITAPARWLVNAIQQQEATFRNIINACVRNSINTFRLPLLYVIELVLKNKKLSERINVLLQKKYPALHGQLQELRVNNVLKNNNNAEYEIISFSDMDIFFATAPLKDNRGIGRVSRELFSAFKELSLESGNKKFAKNLNRKKVYFFASIHWCPEVLPEPSVVMIHDVTPLVLNEIFPKTIVMDWESKYKFIGKQAKRVITISKQSASDISSYLDIDLNKINIIYNGVTSLRMKSLDSRANIPNSYFVYLGAYDHHKNLDIVLQSLTLQGSENFNLVLIGDNINCKPRVDELGLGNRVFILGQLSDIEVANIVGNARALLFPSLYEGFGLPPLEAALLGVPSICSARPAMNEILKGAALFVDPHSSMDWAVAMRSILQNDMLHSEISEAAMEVAKSFTWEKSAQKSVDCLREIAIYEK